MDFPLPNRALPLDQQDPLSLFASINLAESANQKDMAKLGQAMVVRNRWLRKVGFGSTWVAVLLQENAFSVTIPGSSGYAKLLNPLKYETIDTWRRCYLAASIAYYGLAIPDPSMGATFYHDSSMSEPPQASLIDAARQIYSSKEWGTVQRTCVIDSLTFYRQAGYPLVATPVTKAA